LRFSWNLGQGVSASPLAPTTDESKVMHRSAAIQKIKNVLFIIYFTSFSIMSPETPAVAARV
jgi:hypothetical protein